MSGYKLKRLCVARFSLSPVLIRLAPFSVLSGPGGPHRRASVARGHDAVLSLRYRSERVPERTAPANLPCSLGPRNGLPNRHRSRACRPPGTDSADTGQPRESTVQTLRSAVMRRVAAGGKLECVFPRLLAPSITVRAGLQKSRAHQAPDRRVPERCRSRVALPRAHTLPLLIEARGEPTSACKRFFGAILRANAKDRDFRRRSAATVRCRFRPTGGLFFRSEPIGNSRHRP